MHRSSTFVALAACTAGLLSSFAVGQQLRLQRIASGLSFLSSAGAAPGDPSRLFLLEQGRTTGVGRVRIIDLPSGVLRPETYLSISPMPNGAEQGLVGIAFHPNFMSNGYFYVNYTRTPEPGISAGSSMIVRYRAAGGDPMATTADPASAQTVLVIRQPNEWHNSGTMLFGPDGYLYIATGDGGDVNDENNASTVNPPGHTPGSGNAQDITDNLLGKILRIDVDGADNIPGNADDDTFPADPNRNYSIPPNNPFVGTDGDDEIWAYGLRNPWRFSIDRVANSLWIADVGQSVREEINYAPLNFAGLNYGWRCMEGTSCTGLTGCVCNVGLRAPIYDYDHTLDRCSIIGGPVYRGCSMPWLRGAYLFTDFCTNELFTMRYTPGTGITELINRHDEIEPPDGSTDVGSTTAIVEDAQGELYLIDWWGFVFRIVDAANADCDNNGRNDTCDIQAGAPDLNGNGRPDGCDPPDCPADFDQSGGVDGSDVEAFFIAWEASSPRADTNFDGGVDGADVETFFILWEAGGC